MIMYLFKLETSAERGLCRERSLKMSWFDMWYQHSQTQVSVQNSGPIWSYIYR